MMNIAQWVLACISVPAAAGCLFPVVARWFPRMSATVFWPMSFAVSIGMLTLAMTVIGFAELSRVTLLLTLTVFWGMSLAVGRRPPSEPILSRWLTELRSGHSWAWIVLALLGILAIVIAQATYYPFTGDDEISRYAYLARLITDEKHLTPVLRGYPMLLPVAYAVTFFAADGLPEQAARIFPVLFATMTVLATHSLAQRWFGDRAGWPAALTLAATPLFIRWAPIGYADIPSALYFVLGAYAADVWRERLDIRWALLVGILTGLCMWTKQSGFAMFVAIGIVVFTVITSKQRCGHWDRAKRAMLHGSLMLVAATLAGGWWYLRNAYYDGWSDAIPNAGLFHLLQADRSPLQVVPFVGHFTTFGYLTSLLYLGGLIWATSAPRKSSAQWCLLWCTPYTLLWWWRYSYDPRFLLTVLPFYAMLAGGWISSLKFQNSRFRLQKWWLLAVQRGVVLLVVSAGLTQARLGGLIQWISHPTATYAERLTRAKGDLYPAVDYLRNHTNHASKIYSTDVRLAYYLIDRPITVGYPTSTAALLGYDYFVVGAWAESVYNSLGLDDNPLSDLDDRSNFQVVHTGALKRLTIYRLIKP